MRAVLTTVLMLNALSGFSANLCGQETDREPEPRDRTLRWKSGVAAKVNRRVITEADVWSAIGPNALAAMKPEARRIEYQRTLESLILKAIQDQSTERFQLAVSDFDKRNYAEGEKERLGGEDAFNTQLAERGMTEDEFLKEFADSTRRTYYLRSLAGAVGALGPAVRPEHNVEPTAAEIREYYRKHRDSQFRVGRMARGRFLVVSSRFHDNDEQKALEAARQERESLMTGADFQTVARRVMRSDEPSVGALTVLGGEAQEGAFVPPVEVEKYALEGELGAVSEPIPFRRGFYLVRVEERRPERVLPFAEVQHKIRDLLEEAKTKVALGRVQRKLLERSYIWPGEYKASLLRKI